MEIQNINDENINIDYSIDNETYNTNFKNTLMENLQLNSESKTKKIDLTKKIDILNNLKDNIEDLSSNFIAPEVYLGIDIKVPNNEPQMEGENEKNDDKNDNENDSINEDAKPMKYIINKNNFKRKRSYVRNRKESVSYNLFCSNCGKRGHIFNNCNDPLTSCGIICLKKVDNNKIDLFNYKILLVRRKYTIGYIEFLRGKYNINNSNYLNKLFNIMTDDEINCIKENDDFDYLRNKLGMTKYYRNNYKEYEYAKKKFFIVKSKLNYYLKNKKNDWDEPEWGLPKGKRNSREENIDCAIREFEEETGIPANKIKIFKNVKPLEEIYCGINNIKYRHVYYFSILDEFYEDEYEDDFIEINETNENNKHQYVEIDKVKWINYNEIDEIIRYYYISKINVIHKSFQLINNMKHYFE